MTEPAALYSISSLKGVRIAVYGPQMASPQPGDVQISFWVEVGDQPALLFRERVIDGELDLGPDALAHTTAGELFSNACDRAGVCFYRASALLAQAVESYTRAERVDEHWLRQALEQRNMRMRLSACEDKWEVVAGGESVQEATKQCASLRQVAASCGIALPNDKYLACAIASG